MQLKDRNRSPIGGFFYDDPETNRVIVTEGNFEKLVRDVRAWHAANGIKSPDVLVAMIENQICDRQPPDRCFNGGFGDLTAKIIHAGAKAIDKVAGTQLYKKARGCGGCSKRRAIMNSR